MEDRDDEIAKRIFRDIFENIRVMNFICIATGKTEEEVLEMPDDEFEKYHDTYVRSKSWKKN